jgi:DNA-binding HxlR family transcriptional regulator
MLEIVAASDGEWDARAIDFEMSRTCPSGELTVLEELRLIEGDGLIERVERPGDPSFVGWRVTEAGRRKLQGASAKE